MLPAAVVQWYAIAGARVSGLDADLVRAVIDAESAGNPGARSVAGAVGLMQLMPSTAGDCGIHDRTVPLENVRCGATTLALLVHHYGLTLGIAAYNAGSGSLDATGRHFSRLPPQTQRYVRAVIDEYDALQHAALAVAAPVASGRAPVALGFALQAPPSARNACARDAYRWNADWVSVTVALAPKME